MIKTDIYYGVGKDKVNGLYNQFIRYAARLIQFGRLNEIRYSFDEDFPEEVDDYFNLTIKQFDFLTEYKKQIDQNLRDLFLKKLTDKSIKDLIYTEKELTEIFVKMKNIS